MAFGCCSCDNVDKYEDDYSVVRGNDRAQQSEPARVGTSPGNVASQPGAHEAPAVSKAAPPQPQSSGIPPPSTPDLEVPNEHVKLQELVRDFARGACHGIACEVVDPTGQVVKGKYTLDSFLRKLTVQAPAAPQPLEKQIELTSILEVFDRETAGLPKALQGKLRNEQLDCLLAIQSTSVGGGPPQSLYLLAGDALDRDRFLMCMKVLKKFALIQAKGVVP
mmetsp:Transcript_5086/g.7062  ORF Transcript_5086/g.7062 Transcript_5086/m.7062 type:complete len:221 (-) Transcript_5086:59-721(-)